jgi:hypothetical protein
LSKLIQLAEQAIGPYQVKKLEEYGLTVVPLQLMEQLRTVKEQQVIVLDGVMLTVKPFEEDDLETSAAGYVCWD